MRRYHAWMGGVILGVGLLCLTQPARALITALTPLREVLADEEYIFVARVDRIDPDRPAMLLAVEEDLKGKAPFRKLPINLAGDSDARKEKQSAQVLNRLAPDVRVVVFARAEEEGRRYPAFGYVDGTWFQMVGEADREDPSRVRWAFTHCEPYLRRSFKGTTAELRQVIVDGLAGRKAPPKPDPKEPPGLGPERKGEPAGGKSGARLVPGPVLAVIPTVGILGPLAVLAMLFPAVFGGVLVVLRRWLVLLTVASTNSTLYWVHSWFADRIRDSWWGSPLALWLAMALVTLAGALWAWWRHRAAVRAGQAGPTLPRRSESIALWVLSLAGVGMVVFCLVSGGARLLLISPWKALLVVFVTAWLGTLYILWLRFAARKHPGVTSAWPAEVVMLWGLVFACVGLGAAEPPAQASGGGFDSSIATGTEAGTAAPTPRGVVWTFEAPDRGLVASSPLAAGDHVYAAAAHQRGFRRYGRLYALDRATGKEVWHFDDGGKMKQVFSSPCLAEGRLYIGEGFHQDGDCKLYCLDAATGRKLWDFQTKSHTESSPCVREGRVFFGAGDDGVFALEAETGKLVWHFEGPHVDTSPAVVEGRLFGGSGYGERFEAFCLDAATGKPVWRQPSELPVFGSPAVSGGEVFFGTGNGDFVKSDEHPAGALVCLDARTGKPLWRSTVRDGVHTRPAVDGERVYFGSRDGRCHCVDRRTGKPLWEQEMGSPVLASPALGGASLYVAASQGRVCCLDAGTGRAYWTFDAAKESSREAQLLSSPAVTVSREGEAERRQVYFGAGLDDGLSLAARVYCLEDQSGGK